MSATLTIARLTLRDLRGRGAMWLVVAIVAVMVVASRWLAIWALGEEVKLYKEFALSTMGLGAALMAAFGAVPIRRRVAVLSSERVMLTKGLPTFAWCLGKTLGIIASIALAYLLWCGCFALGLWLYWEQEPTLFTYTQNTSVAGQLSESLLPLLLAFLQSALIVAFAVLASATGNLLVTLSSVLALLLVASILPDFAARNGSGALVKGLAYLIPDFRIGLSRETLVFGRVSLKWVGASSLQLIGYGTAFLLLAAALKRSDAKP